MALMSVEEWRRRRTQEQQKPEVNTATAPGTASTGSSNAGGSTSGRSSGGLMSVAEWRAARNRNNTSAGRTTSSNDLSSVQNWLNDSQALLGEIQGAYGSWNTDEDEYENYRSRISNNLALASGLRNQYAGNNDVITAINDAVTALDQAQDYAYQNRNYYSQFGGAEEYQSYLDQQQEYYDNWGHYADEADFDYYADLGAGIENPTVQEAESGARIFGFDIGGADVGNIVTYSRDNWEDLSVAEANGSTTQGRSLYHHMTEDEVKIYNYLLAKEGDKAAQAFLDDIEERLNARMGAGQAERILAIESPVGRSAMMGLYSLGAGLDNAVSGTRQFFQSERQAAPASQFGGQQIAESLDGLGGHLYSAVNTIGNMLPSMAIGLLNPAAGAAAMGVSVSGNAYSQALQEGYSKTQARAYGLLVGAAEAALQYLLGGVKALGGKAGLSSGKIAAKMAAVDNAFLRMSLNLGANILDEIKEEELQNFLEPLFRTIIFGEEYDAPTIDELIETAIVTALSTGLLEGPGTAINELGVMQQDKQYQAIYGESAADLVAEALEIDPNNALAQEMQNRLDRGKDVSGHKIGMLVQQNDAAILDQDMVAIREATAARLEELGETGDVQALAMALTNQARQQSDYNNAVRYYISEGYSESEAKRMAKRNVESNLSREERNLIANSKYGQRVANELNAENISSGQYSTAWAEQIDTNRINVAEYSRLVSDAQMTQETTQTVAEGTTAPVPQTASVASTKTVTDTNVGSKTVLASNYEVSSEGKAELDGNTIVLNGLKKMEDGSIAVVTADNKTADPRDVKYPSAGHALVYENYANIDGADKNPVIANMPVDDRSALAQAFDPAAGVDAKTYFLGSNLTYWYGFEGITMKDSALPKNSLVRSLTEKQRAYAYDLGLKAGKKAAATQDAGIKAAYEKAVEKLGGKEAAAAIAKKNKGKVVLEDGVRKSSMTPKQKASLKLAEYMAEAVGSNVHVYHGMKEYGKYDPETGDIWLNVNGNFDGSSVMAFTLAHELVHQAKQWSPAEFKAFADYLLEQYGKKGVSVEALIREQMANAKRNGYTLDEHEAYEEVIADACQRMLLDSNAVQKMAEYRTENPKGWQKIVDAIKKFIDNIRKLFAGAEPDSMEAALYKEFDDEAKQFLEKLFVDMVMGAGEHMNTIHAAFGKGTVVEVNADGEFTLAKGEGSNGETKFLYNDYTWDRGGRETLQAALKSEGFSAEDIKAALTIMDGKHELVKKLAEQFPEQDRINHATVITDLKDGHSVLSALVSNGDYPVNIDLLMVCKKRKAYQRVINRLCETGMIQQATVDALAIAEINKILGKYGFETACLGCFVESRRLRIQEWANTIVKEWNAEVKKRNPEAKAFGFGKGEGTLTPDEVMHLIGELESGGEKNDQGNLNLGKGSAVKRMGVLLDKVPTLRRTLSIEDLITPDGLTALRKFDSNLFSMVKSRYGSNSPKFVQEFNPYNHELAMYGEVPSEYKSLRDYLYAIGGARMQSFSDFIVENWFDYCQIVADLAARKLPMHTYTKEIALAKLFGLTGIKINMSLIPDIDKSLGKEFAGLTRDENGELVLIWADKDRFKATGGKSYMQSINFADAVALQTDPQYSSNVGTIAIGVSNKQILTMLDDARIRMIIPYHSSGMNPIFADLMGTSFYKDYTNVQNTTVKQLYNSKGEAVSLELEKAQKDKLVSGFQFNAVLQELGDARAAAQAYKDWCADASKHTITIKGETYTAELTPKFEDFSWHDNYYKLLEDFNTYDCLSEQAAPQGDVQQNYPEDFDTVLQDELTVQEGHRQKQVESQAFENAMSEIESYLSTHTKADTVFYAEQHGIKLSDKDKKLGAADKKKLAGLRKGEKMSMPKVPAPTFYSQMEKVVEGMKQERFGAASVVSMLRGKGVKAEEIKWSGIEAWLDGKKSVTKAELLEFIAGSELQIEEEQSDSSSVSLKYKGNDTYKLYDAGGNVLDTFIYNEFVGAYISEKTDEMYTDTYEIEDAVREEYGNQSLPRWPDYKLDGGVNYREIVFKLPVSSYTNNAMRVHWGEEAEGILVHARIQDFETEEGKMLFVEELQSDWHNEGHAKGYSTPDFEDAIAIRDRMQDEYDKIRQAFHKYVRSNEYHTDPEDVRTKKYDWLRGKLDAAEKRKLNAQRDVDALKEEGAGHVPDAPFKDTYHEYVMKRLLREAAEQGYDSIGWTPAEVQVKRWSKKFAEGYRIEYDQDIPKFMNKYGKKWGATVGKTVLDNGTEVWSMEIPDSMKDSVLHEGQPKYSMPKVNSPYSYEALISKPDMVVTTVGGNVPNKRSDVAQMAKKNATKVGRFDPKTGSVSVHVDDIDTDVILSTKGLRHGLRRTQDPLIEPNYIVTVKAGEILKNSIRINETTPSDENANNSYVLMGAARDTNGIYVVRFVVNHFDNDVMAMDVLYAVNAKKELAATKSPRLTAVPLSVTSSTISIEELLDLVNQYFPDILPEDVLKHYGYDSRPEGDLGDDALYKTPNDSGVSPRQLLANAFGELAQTPEEQELMEQYRNSITKVEEVQERLKKVRDKIRELTESKGDKAKIETLNKTAAELADLIDRYDRKLLKLEASAPLRDVLARAKSAAYKRAKQRGENAMKEYKQQVSERFDRGVESRRKTELRHKIKNVVKELNDLLLNESKKRHVPDNLKKAVASSLALVNMDTVGADERIAKYEALIAKETDPDKIEAYTVTMENIRNQGEKIGQRLKELKDAYEEIANSTDPDIANAYDPVIAGSLQELAGTIGDTSLRDMTVEQLEDVSAMYRMVLTRVRDANKTFLDDKRQSISNLASRVVGEVRRVGGEHKSRAAILDPVAKFKWDNQKPVYAMEAIGSDTMIDVFNELLVGEGVYATDVSHASGFADEKKRKYKFNSWDFNKKYRFTSTSGIEFDLTLEQIMSLYAYSKRNQAHDHLRLGGFVFDSNIETYEEKGKKGKKGVLKYKVNTADAHQLTPEILLNIIGKLSAEQRAFVDEMQDYLSTTMGAKGNEVTMKMYGVKLFKEKFYFPLKSAKQFMFEQNEAAGEVKIKNSGFTNKLVAKANNPIILSNFMDVWAGHVHDMSMYHSFVLPLEDFNRVFNYNSQKAEGQPPVSVKGTIQSAYGPAAVSYIKQLITDLNGGAVTDPRETIAKAAMSNFKKAAVLASASVVIQQPSAIGRATALVDSKYFIGPKVDSKRHKALWAEVKKYAPVAIIKEMGYFDTGMGRSAQDFIKGDVNHGWWDKTKTKVDDLATWAPAKADELTWCAIWEAVKRETKAKNKGIDVNSEAFLKMAGKRFTEVITKTQVYDSVLSRSGYMRSKSGLMNMMTSFMAEPTTTANMVEDALRKGKRGNKKYAARTLGAALASITLNALLSSIVYAARDDDEDETFLEKYLQSFATEMLDGINPLTYYPFLKDIWSALQGFDIERADMSLITRLIEATTKLIQAYGKDTSDMDEAELKAHQKDIGNAWWGLVDYVTAMVGLPVKNVRRDLIAGVNVIRTIREDLSGRKTTWGSLVDKVWDSVRSSIPVVGWLRGETAADKLYEAIVSGDEAYRERLEATYESDTSLENAIRRGLRANDPRIREAAEARLAGDFERYKELFYEIKDEGNFNRDVIMSAIYAEYNSIVEEEPGYKAPERENAAESIFNVDDYYNAVINGDYATASSIANDLIAEKKGEGYLTHEAKDAIASSFAANVKEAYMSDRIEFEQAADLLVGYGGKDSEDEAESEIAKWDFELDHGYSWGARARGFRLGHISENALIEAVMEVEGATAEEANEYIRFLRLEMANENIDLTATDAAGFFQYAQPAGIGVDVYLDYKARANACDGQKDENGKTISGSKKAEIMDVIDSLPLSDDQKDALYRANDWSEKELQNAPWHQH